MPKRCVVMNCSTESYSGIALYDFPADSKTSRLWDKFVVDGNRKNWSLGRGSKSVQICALHFLDSNFKNYFRWSHGGNARLYLEKNAVPSVFAWLITPQRRQELTRNSCTQPLDGAPINTSTASCGTGLGM